MCECRAQRLPVIRKLYVSSIPARTRPGKASVDFHEEVEEGEDDGLNVR